jgi:hypothetical protein
MERVETLLQKLQQQFKDGAQPSQLLLTVQMLQYELAHLQHSEGTIENSTMAAVSMPLEVFAAAPEVAATPEKPKQEEKIIEVLQVDEAEIEAELEEIKRNAAAMQKISVQSRPQLLFDPIEDDEDIPTLAQRRENRPPVKKEVNDAVANNDAGSVNDRLKEAKTELSEKLNEASIKDLKKAIGVNDRFLFINELFRGDEAMYERSIKTINGFSIFPEAEYWIRRELKVKLGWTDSNETVKQFDQLVKRRFG